ncbi:hypothetical protein ACHHYP_12041 [Achlya hypogyna]|uniref:Mbre TPR repeat protein n=1 Tax=Achlya hypogyna TaxID=1202772 RepID=A0A1V9YHP0_ACHHY|nr:hypothetical protein ACHHYP_12041 [Achlya hypogyna]
MEPSSATPLPLGVTLAFFRHLIDLCGGRTKLQGHTTAQVCFDYIVPLTASTQLSLVEHIAADAATAHFVRPANWYISHAWSYLFLETVDSLEVFFAQQQLTDEAVVWFCVFNNNQHRAAGFPFEYWSSTFKSQLSAIGNVVMVMHPWNDPVVLRRSWCVFEVYVAVTTGARFEMAMAPDQLKLLIDDLDEVAYDRMLTAIKSEQSQTTVPSDRDGIFALIQAETSFIEVDRLIFSTILTWIKRALHRQVTFQANTPVEQALTWKQLRSLYRVESDWSAYVRCSEQIYHCFSQAHGSNHEETLYAAATWYTAQAKISQPYASWGPPLEKILPTVEARIGVGHLQTCYLRQNIATTLLVYSEDHDVRTEQLLQQNRELLLVAPGPQHILTMLTAIGLGRVYLKLHRLQDAEQWLSLAINDLNTHLGPEHILAALAQNLLALVHVELGRPRDALPVLEANIQLALRVFGKKNDTTATMRMEYGHTLYRAGEPYRAAAELDTLVADTNSKVDLARTVVEAQEARGLAAWAAADYAMAAACFQECAVKFRSHHWPRAARKCTARLFMVLLDASVRGVALKPTVAASSWGRIEDEFTESTDTPEVWTKEFCAGCHEAILGSLHICDVCPRGAYTYCHRCWNAGNVLCGHDEESFLSFSPPHRHLLEKNLQTFDGPLDAFEDAFRGYETYCIEQRVPLDERQPRAALGYEIDTRLWHPMF